MQRLAGIHTEETFESVLKDFLLEIELHEQALNEGQILNESLWEKTKYYLSKLGRYKVNGKFFGKKKELEASRKRISDMLEKESNAKIRELIDNIKNYVPEFPNNESADQFLDTCLHIAKVYDSIVAATKKDPEDKEFMPIDMANELITDLRAYVKHILDAELKSGYTVTNEAEENTKIGDIENYDKRRKKELLKQRRGKTEFSSERMKTLRSWRLPASLFGVGGALGGLSWILDFIKTKADFIHVLKGEGMTQILNRAGDRGDWGLPKLSPDSPLSDVKDYITKVGEGDYNTGIDRLTADNGMFTDPDAASQALGQMDNADPNTSLEDFFKNKLAGTGKMPGDMLVTKALGPLLLKQGVKAIAPWLGSFASGLGVALVVGSAATALGRLKGRKSSRAATLDDLYQSLKNIKPTEENPEIVPGGNSEPKPTSPEKPSPDTDRTPEKNEKGDEIADKAIKSQSRDKEIVALLKIANPNLELNAETKPIIQQIRRYPNGLINKMSAILGIDLGTRQKATKKFQRSGMAEMVLDEDAMDDKLAKLGVTVDAIKANKDAISKLITSMYKLQGGNQSQKPSEKTLPDVARVNKDIADNNAIGRELKDIDKEEELSDLLVAFVKGTDQNFQKNPQNVQSAFNNVTREVPKFYSSQNVKYSVVKEEEKKIEKDTTDVVKIMDRYPNLKRSLSMINNGDELKQFILKVIFPNVNSKLAGSESRMVRAIQLARTKLANLAK